MPASKGHVLIPATGERISCLVYPRLGNSVYSQLVAGILGDVDEDDFLLRVITAGTLQALPTSFTDLASGDCKLARLYIHNPTNGILKASLRDKTAVTPIALFTDVEIPPKDSLGPRDFAVKLTGGAQWKGEAGLVGFAVIYQ